MKALVSSGRRSAALKSGGSWRARFNANRGASVKHLQERLLGVQSGGDKSLGADGFSTRQSNTRDPSTTD